jgi:hypothetical protein
MHETDTMPAAKRNVVRWGSIGAAAGALVGLIFGLAFTTPGRFGSWMALLTPTLFFGAVSAFTAGIASLRSPSPGEEPPDDPSNPPDIDLTRRIRQPRRGS